jgi:tetratricopeptide (TPR) repeat protein
LATSAILNLGQAHFRQNDFPGAEKYYQDGLALARGSNPRLTAFALLSLASLHDQLKRADDAAQEATEALSFYQPNGFRQESAFCLTILSRIQCYRGDYQAALDSAQRLLYMAEKAQDRRQTALAHESIGSAYRGQDRFVEALKHFQIFLDLSADPEKAGYAALECGDVLWALGRYGEASAMFDKATLSAAKFASLRLHITRARAEMDLSKRHFMEASVTARGALAGLSSQDATAADWKAILGLAQVGLGDKAAGLRNCEESLAATLKTNDSAGILHGSLAVLEARLANGNRKGAINLFTEMQPALPAHPESRWRALALASSADQAYAEDALRALNVFGGQLGEEIYRSYLSRPDIRQLSWPLLKLNNANQ